MGVTYATENDPPGVTTPSARLFFCYWGLCLWAQASANTPLHLSTLWQQTQISCPFSLCCKFSFSIVWEHSQASQAKLPRFSTESSWCNIPRKICTGLKFQLPLESELNFPLSSKLHKSYIRSIKCQQENCALINASYSPFTLTPPASCVRAGAAELLAVGPGDLVICSAWHTTQRQEPLQTGTWFIPWGSQEEPGFLLTPHLTGKR